MRGILKLGEKDRVMILLYRDNFSYREIAEILEINYNSVGKMLSRVIDKLKTIIGESNELFR